MRLHVVSTGHAPAEKRVLERLRASTGMEPVDVLKALLYRPDFWGGPMQTLLQSVMRGPSEWSVGERELMAAFTSKLNACRF